ncbi:hypothetical protein GCM10009601_44770 [Streptomyces thermospinosisporus]|uniref:HTH cro/C1-type domain-containing protein n=1 Tax=Streptomyces thermospinosisporus TaxID=161482 RepID=A0ABP4JWD3_9ACTN
MANGSRQAAWEFFGAELKRRREEAGFTQVELGARVFVSGGYIGQFEQAIRKPQLDVAQRIDEVLQTDGIFERLWRKLIKDQPYTEYFAHAVELERMATEICEYAPTVVPGLLQTREYARAMFVAGNPFAPDEHIEELIKGRMDRARVLKDATRPLFGWCCTRRCSVCPSAAPQSWPTSWTTSPAWCGSAKCCFRYSRSRLEPIRPWASCSGSWSSRMPHQRSIQKACFQGACWTNRRW